MVLELKNEPTLKDYQKYVLQMKQERGFNTTDKFYECCLLAEECGELISAIRKKLKIRQHRLRFGGWKCSRRAC